MNMNVRLAQEDDASTILRLMQESSLWMKQWGYHQWTNAYPRELLISEISNARVFMAVKDQLVIGTVTLDETAGSYWRVPLLRAQYLHRLIIDRAYAGKSLGKELMQWSERFAASRGHTKMRLDCDAKNDRLRDYYEALGYAMLGIESDSHYQMDFALYEKSLKIANKSELVRRTRF